MQRRDAKVALCLPYLKSANLIAEQLSEDELHRVEKIVAAAGDRIKVAGDVLDYDDFFASDEALVFNAADVEKRLKADPTAVGYVKKYREVLSALGSFDVATLEQSLTQFMDAEGIKFKQIIHALRVALTGKSVGFGMFDAMAILGKQSCLARIDRAMQL